MDRKHHELKRRAAELERDVASRAVESHRALDVLL